MTGGARTPPMALPPNPLDRLQLCARIVAGTAPALAEWLETGTRAHIYGTTSLDQALGLRGNAAGVRTARLEYLMRERNCHLRAALALLGGDVGRLATEIDNFEARVLPRLRRGSSASLSPLQQHLFDAFGLGVAVPSTKKGLDKALAAEN